MVLVGRISASIGCRSVPTSAYRHSVEYWPSVDRVSVGTLPSIGPTDTLVGTESAECRYGR